MDNEQDTRLTTADIATGADGHGAEQTEYARTPQDGRDESPQVAPLMPEESVTAHRERWRDIQATFVDAPQESVREADGLVAEIIQTLATSFADQRKGLEDQWSRGGEVSTEDLRRALQQYRSFFERLLAA